MNILIDLRPLQNGKISGVEVFTENITRKLTKEGEKHNFFLWTNAAKKLPENFPKFSGKNVVRIHTKKSNRFLNLFLSLFRYPKIDQLVKKKCLKYGLLSKNDNFDAIFIPDLRPAPISKNVKKFIMFHDLSFIHFKQTFSCKTKIWHKLLRPKKEAKEAFKIFTPSEFTKNDLILSYKIPEEKIVVISEGVDEKFFPKDEVDLYEVRKKYNLPKKFLLTLSTLEPRKNLNLLIDAFSLFSRKFSHEDLYLVIAGQRHDSIFAKTTLPEKAKVVFPGFIKEEHKPALYSSALAFIFPSLFEGFGLPVVEAMASGAPVISSNYSSLPEVAKDSALFFDPLDKEELCAKIEEIYFNPELRKELSQKGRIKSKEFNWNKVAQKALHEIINETENQ